MKKYLFFSLFAALLFSNCKDEDFGPTYKIGNAPSLTAPAAAATFVFEEDKADEEFGKFTWTAADYGFNAGISYTVEMDLAGANFSEPVTLGTVNALELTGVTVGKINNILLTKGRPGEEPSNVEFRVRAKVNPEVQELISAPVAAKVTPYSVIIVYPQLQVPGAYQGWDPSNNTTVIFSVKGDGKFEGYMYFPAGTEFKYTDGPSWSVNFGDNNADGTLEPDGANIKIVDEGMYRLNVDLNAKTHTYALTNWGLIGSATPTGWDSDTDMIYDAANNKLTLTIDLGAGEIKFRANDDWAINMGDTGANKSLEYGGDNIQIAEAGNYTIDLILSGAVYTYKITKN